jgi:Pin2-interacting protein X1
VARFGHEYLSKLGWTSTSGLGAELDGTTGHIPIAQKLNMLGIGADNRDGPEAIAWKQNQDFEGVLKRLNASSDSPKQPLVNSEIEDTVVPLATSNVPPVSNDDEQVQQSRKRAKKEKRASKASSKKLEQPSTIIAKPGMRLA